MINLGGAKLKGALFFILLFSATNSFGFRAEAEDMLAKFEPPAASAYPKGELGAAVQRGEKIVTLTPQLLRENVGNTLSCTSCHLSGGRVKDALPWVGVYSQFPQYNARAGFVITLEDRINQCFLRSLNGHALKPDSQAMRDIVAYIAWLSKGVPVGEKMNGSGIKYLTIKDKSDSVAGKSLYSAKCAACHGTNGEGKSDSSGHVLYTALWGQQSFNDGAGMTRPHTAEAFIKSNMPFGSGGTLTDKEARDIAAYVTAQPRPKFGSKNKDWPHGGKPEDATY